VLDDEELVGAPGREAAGDDDRRPSGEQCVERALDQGSRSAGRCSTSPVV
jgi:hypothetical protein